jgi:hypothetical protein
VWIALARIVAGVIVSHGVLVLFPRTLLHSPLGTLSAGTWFGAFDRWDARYYLLIAAHGYPLHFRDARAFFPGYPLLIRLVHMAAGGALSYLEAACLLSWAAFVLAAALLYRLVASRFGTRAGVVSTVLFCWFPATVFYLAPYSEALFGLEILLVATLAERGRWWAAAAVAGCATATSPQGAVLVVALVVGALVAGRGLWRAVGYGAVASSGGVAYVLFLQVQFGQPFAFLTVQSDFHRVMIAPFEGLVENFGAIHHALTIHSSSLAGLPNLTVASLWSNVAWMWTVDDAALVLAIVALVTLIIVALRHRTAASPAEPAPAALAGGEPTAVPILWIIVLGGITLIVSATAIHGTDGPVSTESAARLVSVAFPLYPGLYLMVRRWQAPIILGIALSVTAALVTQILFTMGYWVT